MSVVRLPSDRLIRFCSGEAPDDRGRYVDEILRWSDSDLEFHHDFIQWLFPLPEPGVNPTAPLLDSAAIGEFRSRPELANKLHQAFLRMLAFYGLEMRGDAVVQAASFRERAANWITPGNHNFRRITRMLRSLRLLGLERDAQSLFECLKRIAESQPDTHPISAATFAFWEAAAHGKL